MCLLLTAMLADMMPYLTSFWLFTVQNETLIK